ncbi:hypothetical protein MT997_11690 [Paenibacillus sp. OVF10]|nr:hypothetical protein MT997_11690 [Paenibacillus sp. OVF10]
MSKHYPRRSMRDLQPHFATTNEVKNFVNLWGIFTVNGQQIVAFVKSVDDTNKSMLVLYPNGTQSFIDVTQISQAQGPYPSMPSSGHGGGHGGGQWWPQSGQGGGQGGQWWPQSGQGGGQGGQWWPPRSSSGSRSLNQKKEKLIPNPYYSSWNIRVAYKTSFIPDAEVEVLFL